VPILRRSVSAGAKSASASFDGLLFWWDADHVFDHRAYRLAVLSAQEGLQTLVGESPAELEAELKASYPNPFNGRVVIPYEVAHEGLVTLRVYNASSGQRVRELFRGQRKPGRYCETWNGRDDDGREIASGVYLWELRGGGAVVRQTVTLIR